MTEEQKPAFESQAPQRADYQRAAALMLHQYRGDTLGWNSVVAEADQLARMSALLLAVGEIAGKSPEALATPQGMAGLQSVATGLALDDDPPAS